MRLLSLYILAFLGLTNLYGQDSVDYRTIDRKLREMESFGLTPDDADKIEGLLDESDSLDYTAGKMRSLQLLYRNYKKSGDYKKALSYHQRYLDLKDRIYSENQESIKKEFENRYEPEKKEAEIKLLQSRNELELLDLSRKRLILYSTLGGVVLLVVIVFLIYRSYQIKQKAKMLLKHQNLSFNEFNEQLKKINEELEKSEHDLRRLNQTKDRFFLLISEELRSPLSSLSNLLGTLIRDGQSFTKEQINEFAVNINDSVNSLLELIENLLQWSRIQMDTISYSEETINLNSLVDENIQMLKTQAEANSIKITYEGDSEQIQGDRNMVHFIIRNLILNAIKFSDPSSGLIIESKTTDNQVSFSIIARMSRDLVKKINDLWESHKQIGESIIKDEKTSLGLLLTKYFVEKNSGSLSVVNENDTSRFQLQLKSGQ